MDDLFNFVLLAMLAVIPIVLGIVSAWVARRRWDAKPRRRARNLFVLAALINVAVVLSAIPELATYPISHGGLMHAPAMARMFAVFAALFSLGFVLPLAIPLVRRTTEPRQVRLLGIVSIGFALLPLPLHRLLLAVIENLFGIHFFWR